MSYADVVQRNTILRRNEGFLNREHERGHYHRSARSKPLRPPSGKMQAMAARGRYKMLAFIRRGAAVTTRANQKLVYPKRVALAVRNAIFARR